MIEIPLALDPAADVAYLDSGQAYQRPDPPAAVLRGTDKLVLAIH